ncbi:hypothetical protein KCU85_g34, partial [Aureobasidium melanogenum]
MCPSFQLVWPNGLCSSRILPMYASLTFCSIPAFSCTFLTKTDTFWFVPISTTTLFVDILAFDLGLFDKVLGVRDYPTRNLVQQALVVIDSSFLLSTSSSFNTELASRAGSTTGVQDAHISGRPLTLVSKKASRCLASSDGVHGFSASWGGECLTVGAARRGWLGRSSSSVGVFPEGASVSLIDRQAKAQLDGVISHLFSIETRLNECQIMGGYGRQSNALNVGRVTADKNKERSQEKRTSTLFPDQNSTCLRYTLLQQSAIPPYYFTVYSTTFTTVLVFCQCIYHATLRPGNLQPAEVETIPRPNHGNNAQQAFSRKDEKLSMNRLLVAERTYSPLLPFVIKQVPIDEQTCRKPKMKIDKAERQNKNQCKTSKSEGHELVAAIDAFAMAKTGLQRNHWPTIYSFEAGYAAAETVGLEGAPQPWTRRRQGCRRRRAQWRPQLREWQERARLRLGAEKTSDLAEHRLVLLRALSISLLLLGTTEAAEVGLAAALLGSTGLGSLDLGLSSGDNGLSDGLLSSSLGGSSRSLDNRSSGDLIILGRNSRSVSGSARSRALGSGLLHQAVEEALLALGVGGDERRLDLGGLELSLLGSLSGGLGDDRSGSGLDCRRVEVGVLGGGLRKNRRLSRDNGLLGRHDGSDLALLLLASRAANLVEESTEQAATLASPRWRQPQQASPQQRQRQPRQGQQTRQRGPPRPTFVSSTGASMTRAATTITSREATVSAATGSSTASVAGLSASTAFSSAFSSFFSSFSASCSAFLPMIPPKRLWRLPLREAERLFLAFLAAASASDEDELEHRCEERETWQGRHGLLNGDEPGITLGIAGSLEGVLVMVDLEGELVAGGLLEVSGLGKVQDTLGVLLLIGAAVALPVSGFSPRSQKVLLENFKLLLAVSMTPESMALGSSRQQRLRLQVQTRRRGLPQRRQGPQLRRSLWQWAQLRRLQGLFRLDGNGLVNDRSVCRGGGGVVDKKVSSSSSDGVVASEELTGNESRVSGSSYRRSAAISNEALYGRRGGKRLRSGTRVREERKDGLNSRCSRRKRMAACDCNEITSFQGIDSMLQIDYSAHSVYSCRQSPQAWDAHSVPNRSMCRLVRAGLVLPHLFPAATIATW